MFQCLSVLFFVITDAQVTVFFNVRLLDFDLHPGREDGVDFILRPAAVPPSIPLGQTLDYQGVRGVVRKGRVRFLEPEEVGFRDTSGSALQHQLLTFDPWSGLGLLCDLHTL